MALSPEEILLRWFNYHLEQAGHPRRVHNFSADIMVNAPVLNTYHTHQVNVYVSTHLSFTRWLNSKCNVTLYIHVALYMKSHDLCTCIPLYHYSPGF